MNEDKILERILSRDLTWEGLIREVVREEGMDPWDINISLLLDHYMEVVKKLKEVDYRIAGKFLLAASILLKMKADSIMLNEEEISLDEMQKRLRSELDLKFLFEDTGELTPRIPPARKRNVTVDELVHALRHAMDIEKRRTAKLARPTIPLVLNRVSMEERMKQLYAKIESMFKTLKKSEINFFELVPSREKEDIIYTFVSLLFLMDRNVIRLRQEQEFGDIFVRRAS